MEKGNKSIRTISFVALKSNGEMTGLFLACHGLVAF